MNKMQRTLVTAAGLILSLGAQAQIQVSEAWIRATVAQQKATGAFMQITASQDSRLVAVSTPLTSSAEIHEMAMDNNVMKMRQIAALPLPAGKAVALKPGGYHIMLMDLKAPVQAGQQVPLSLVLEDASGKRQTLEVKAEVRALGATPMKPDAHAGHQH